MLYKYVSEEEWNIISEYEEMKSKEIQQKNMEEYYPIVKNLDIE